MVQQDESKYLRMDNKTESKYSGMVQQDRK